MTTLIVFTRAKKLRATLVRARRQATRSKDRARLTELIEEIDWQHAHHHT